MRFGLRVVGLAAVLFLLLPLAAAVSGGSVRLSHRVETASSNFVFGCIVGASFARPRERRSVEAVTTGA